MEFATPFVRDECPCTKSNRLLEQEESGGSLWEIVFTSLVLLFMFIALILDRIGADMVMMIALSLLMASEIITVEEGVAGFANEGLLTVLILFVVAAGISHTGALDWYMSKMLGRPKSVASAQIRLMIPIAIVSAFLNNTPVVCVMIPIVQRWGKNVGVSPQQLLIPLSFASILGGTCTLIGTSTNLVVVGLLQARYPGSDVGNVGLFDLGKFGVPVALVGLTYILLASKYLIPGGARFIGGGASDDGVMPADLDDSILLGARLTKWSAAVGRSVKRSGLRDTGGLYLVSVHRAATGNVHRAVGQDFVLNVGDVLYFTGLVEGFGDFCHDNGLEVITNEVEDSIISGQISHANNDEKYTSLHRNEGEEKLSEVSNQETTLFPDTFQRLHLSELGVSSNNRLTVIPEFSTDIGTTIESLLQADDAERQRAINRIQDKIRGIATMDNEAESRETFEASKIIAVVEKDEKRPLVIVAVNVTDRPGLLLDISKSLIRLGLNFHRTEASVIDDRSLSLWRCEAVEGNSDVNEIWSVLNAMLESDSGIEAMKHRGLRVLRAAVTKNSELIGHTAAEINFRDKYKAAIIAVQQDGTCSTEKLSQVHFKSGDVLVLQASDESPLLIRPPLDFYKSAPIKKGLSTQSLSRFMKKRIGSFGSLSDVRSEKSDESNHSKTTTSRQRSNSQENLNLNEESTSKNDISGKKYEFFVSENADEEHVIENGEDTNSIEGDLISKREQVWKNLTVAFPESDGEGDNEIASREFLTAMEVATGSKLVSNNVENLGLDKLPGVFLVSIERPTHEQHPLVVASESYENLSPADSIEKEVLTQDPRMAPVSPDDPLAEGDILWFSGEAAAIGDLRKIPGLKSYVNEEVKKINEKVHDRRLVQAVIARRSKLVGKTIREAQFRTRYGAAVISVHREGQRVQEHPGKIKLQAGDVLLLEAGPTFINKSANNDSSFSLLSEVQDSAPPRLKLLIPALFISVAMLAVYSAGISSLLVCGLVASLLMTLCGILSQQEVRDAVNWEIYITIASAFGIGTALTNSGIAGGIANGLVKLGQAINIGDAGLYGAVYFATFLISNVVTNNAAAALLFPIAMDAAEMTGADRKLMSYTLMLGASASFMSPFGYTTNLLIYGPGGYKYNDFLRVGTPMQVLLWLLSITIVSTTGIEWYLTWLISFTAFVFVFIVLVLNISPLSLVCNFFRRNGDTN